MTTHPRSTQDLLLAPVAVDVDGNLRRLRDKAPSEIAFELVLEIEPPPDLSTPAQRIAGVVDVATREVNMHDWAAEITEDHARLRLVGGSVTLDLGLSASIIDYITNGAEPTP
jgi:hypothetical protein